MAGPAQQGVFAQEAPVNPGPGTVIGQIRVSASADVVPAAQVAEQHAQGHHQDCPEHCGRGPWEGSVWFQAPDETEGEQP